MHSFSALLTSIAKRKVWSTEFQSQRGVRIAHNVKHKGKKKAQKSRNNPQAKPQILPWHHQQLINCGAEEIWSSPNIKIDTHMLLNAPNTIFCYVNYFNCKQGNTEFWKPTRSENCSKCQAYKKDGTTKSTNESPRVRLKATITDSAKVEATKISIPSHHTP